MEGDPTSNSPPSNSDGTKSTENGASSAITSAAKKTFKAQSLSSLFQKTASVSSHNGASQAGSPKGSSDKVSLMKKSSPTTKNASPVGTQTTTLAKPMTSMSTATGTYKLAAMKRDIKSTSSPGSSSNNSPRPENATVWKKPEDHSSSNNVSPIMTSASTIAVSTNEKHDGNEPQDTATTSQQETSAEQEPAITNKDTKDLSEEELVKRGIHLTQRLSTSSQRTFNWDEDDEDDWTQSLPLPEIKEPPPPATPKHEEESSKAAPWVNASLNKPQVVPIAEQIKQLSEQKSQRHPLPRRGGGGTSGGAGLQQHHHHQPIQVGKNVPHFNYRLDSKPAPPPGPPADDRYRYPDFEKRYRSDVPPPRQELYNASSGTVEPAWRRDRRPTHPEQVPGPTAEEKKKEEEAIREKQAQVMREAREKARKRKEEELRREEERKAAAKKKADELAARIAERERKAAEEKRQKEEEERRKKKEAEEAALKKKQEEEEERKRKKKAAEEEAAAAAAAAAAVEAETQKSTEDRGRANAPGNIRSHRSKSSIDENQALRTVSSVLDDEKSEHSDKPKLWSEPASATGSRLWNSSDNNSNNSNNNHSAGTSPNNGTANHRKSDELWLPVQASTNRFSSAIARSGPTSFGTKDDLVLLREQQQPRGNRWDEATSWRRAPSPPEPRESKAPGTPSRGGAGQTASPETTPTSGHRGMSRFFPSPQVEKNNSNSPEGLNVSPWTGSPRSMLLHRESLLPSSNGDKQLNRNWASSVNTGGSGGATANDTSSPSRPRVLLPAGENKHHSSTNSSHNPRLPSLDSIQALQSTIAQKLGGKLASTSNHMTKSALPIPESPVVNSIEESSIPFPPLAREERLQRMIMEKEDKRTRQLLQTQSNTIPQHEGEDGKKMLSTKLPPASGNTDDEGENEIVLIFDKRVSGPKTDSLRYHDKQGRKNQREYIVDANNPVKVSQVRMPGKSTVTISGPRPRRLGGRWRSRQQ